MPSHVKLCPPGAQKVARDQIIQYKMVGVHVKAAFELELISIAQLKAEQTCFTNNSAMVENKPFYRRQDTLARVTTQQTRLSIVTLFAAS